MLRGRSGILGGRQGGCQGGKQRMLRRLISRFVPGFGLEDPETEAELTDVAQALAPYRDEPVAPVLRLAEPPRD